MRRFSILAIFVLLVSVLVGQVGRVTPIHASPFEDVSKWTAQVIPSTPSTGNTAQILVAGVAHQVIIPVKLTIVNHDTVEHTLNLISNVTGFDQIILPPGAAYALDNDNGWLRTKTGEDFKFNIDGGGVGTTVSISGVAMQSGPPGPR